MEHDRIKIEAGERLAEARNQLRVTQNELADRVGITRERLAKYEKGLGCLRCGIAFTLCRNLLLSEQWLATGEGKQHQFKDVQSFFPKERLNKPFLSEYRPIIEKIYTVELATADTLLALLRYDDLHPDIYRQFFFDEAVKSASRVYSKEFLPPYWLALAEKSVQVADKFSCPPRERRIDLNEKLEIKKAGNAELFSYQKFFDDLSLIGLEWREIEIIADVLESQYTLPSKTIDIEMLKKVVLECIREIGSDDRCASLYQKLYCRPD